MGGGGTPKTIVSIFFFRVRKVNLENCSNRKDLTVHWVRGTLLFCDQLCDLHKGSRQAKGWSPQACVGRILGMPCQLRSPGDAGDSKQWRVSPQRENKASPGFLLHPAAGESPTAPWEGRLSEILISIDSSLRLEGANWTCFYGVLKHSGSSCAQPALQYLRMYQS